MSKDGGKNGSRRQALAWLAASAAGAATATVARAKGEVAPTTAPPAPSRCFAMAIDLDRCLRCRTCVVACAAENNVLPVGWKLSASMRAIHWMDVLVPTDERFDLGAWPAPIPCMHCERPECERVCPVGATYRNDDGIVVQIWERCVGCRYCMVACPYSRRYYNWTEPEWPDEDAGSANPDVAIRHKGMVEKCTFCQHRVRALLERARVSGEPVTDEELVHLPACAAACPAEAITFGDLLDPSSTIAELSKSPRVIRLLVELATGPKVFYLGSKR